MVTMEQVSVNLGAVPLITLNPIADCFKPTTILPPPSPIHEETQTASQESNKQKSTKVNIWTKTDFGSVVTSSSEVDDKRKIHKCDFPTCDKVYTKSSHLKAHKR